MRYTKRRFPQSLLPMVWAFTVLCGSAAAWPDGVEATRTVTLPLTKYTTTLQTLWIEAAKAAQGQLEITDVDVALELLKLREGRVHDIIKESGINRAALIAELTELQRRQKPATPETKEAAVGPLIRPILNAAEKDAKDIFKDELVSPEVVLLAIIKDRSDQCKAGEALRKAGLSVDKLMGLITGLRVRIKEPVIRDANVDTQYGILEKMTVDMTLLAAQGKYDPVEGRDNEVEMVIKVLSRRQKNNPVLRGEPGTGKTAIVEELCRRIVNGDVPGNLLGKRVVALEMGSMLAGSKYRGEFEERLKSVLAELKKDPDTIVFIDELHSFFGDDENQVKAANTFKPAMSRGEIMMIGATTVDESTKIEKDKAIERRLQFIEVDPPSVEQTIRILRALQKRYEEKHRVSISTSGRRACALFSDRYITTKFQPDKAIDLMDLAMVEVRYELDARLPKPIRDLNAQIKELEAQKADLEELHATTQEIAHVQKSILELTATRDAIQAEWVKGKAIVEAIAALVAGIEANQTKAREFSGTGKLAEAAELLTQTIPDQKKKVGEKQTELQAIRDQHHILYDRVEEYHVALVVNRITRVPMSHILGTDDARLNNLEEELNKRVVGQPVPVRMLVEAMQRRRSGLGKKDRPLGTFIFMGPTGVGKTELGYAFAEIFFGDRAALKTLEGGELQLKTAVARLIGADPGHVGYEEGGELTEFVRRRPYCVVLFNEVEKAHADLWDLLLGIEKGEITDAKRRVINFRNVLIILTTNIGAEKILGTPANEEIKMADVIAELNKYFRMEFINRLDGIGVFRDMDVDKLELIVALQVNGLAARAAEKRITIEMDKLARRKLAEMSVSQLGGREVQRVIVAQLENPLSEMMNKKKLLPGDKVVISVNPEGTALTFNIFDPEGRCKDGVVSAVPLMALH